MIRVSDLIGVRDVQMANPRRGTLNPLLLFYFQCSIFYILGKTEFFHCLYIGSSSILSPLGSLFLLLWSFSIPLTMLGLKLFISC